MISPRPRTFSSPGVAGGGEHTYSSSVTWHDSWRESDSRRRHASRGGRGSMGGHAPEVPQSNDGLQESGKVIIVASGSQAKRASGQRETHEEPGEHHEAVEPHKTWFHDQHGREQTYR